MDAAPLPGLSAKERRKAKMDDVIVAGAGPAGATAARLLAQQGWSVRLLEAQPLPRIKPCGGALTHRAMDLVPPALRDLAQTHPHRWTFRARGQQTVTLSRHQPYCHVVARPQFDAALADSARQAGAHVQDGHPVTLIVEERDHILVQAGTDRYVARYLIAADGAKGPSGRMLGLAQVQYGAAIEVEVPVSDQVYQSWQDRIEIDVSHFPWGYGWVIPRYPLLNIGVGSFRPTRMTLKAAFYRYAENILGKALPSGAKPLGHPLPYRSHLPTLHRARVVWVGDAAGLLDAFSAEGIFSALWSATLAAEVVGEALARKQELQAYSHRVRREIWSNLEPAVRMGRLFYPLAGFWSRFFIMNQSLLEDYLDVAQGQKTYRDLLDHTQRILLGHLTFKGTR